MDKELEEFLDRKFSQIDERIDITAERAARRFQIAAGPLEDNLQQITEGITNLSERFDRRLDEMDSRCRIDYKELLCLFRKQHNQ